VPQSGAATAREALLQAELLRPGAPSPQLVAPVRLLAGLIGALALGALLVWVALEVLK
jgi:hypothetical protein